MPPMVGVPAFDRWRSGPSGRICWPIWLAVSLRISQGPKRNENRNAVSAASTVRNVM